MCMGRSAPAPLQPLRHVMLMLYDTIICWSGTGGTGRAPSGYSPGRGAGRSTRTNSIKGQNLHAQRAYGTLSDSELLGNAPSL